MDPFLSSRIESGVKDVLLKIKEAKLEELKKFYDEYPDRSLQITLERRLLEAEINSLRSMTFYFRSYPL